MVLTETLPWHQALWTQLGARRDAGRLPHALLLAGPAGLGKTRFAERLVHWLLCAAPTGDGACGQCKSCRLLAAGSHPDYTRVSPLEPGKPIRVDQIRELGVYLAGTSQFGGHKIALLDPAERMNVNAANSLLKTLEEPPAGSLLLLVTAMPSRLPATVRSRCQTLAFRRPAARLALDWLAERVPGADPALLLALAGGAPLTALALAEPQRLERRRTLLGGLAQVSAGTADPVQAAEPWLQGEAAENLRWLVEWHGDMIRLKMTAQAPRLLHPDLRPELERLGRGLSTAELFRRLDEAMRIYELRDTQVNGQMMMEAFLGACAGRRHPP